MREPFAINCGRSKEKRKKKPHTNVCSADNGIFVAHFPESLPVKELWTSVENWQNYRLELGTVHNSTWI